MLTIVVFSLILFTSGIVGMMPSVFAQPAAGDIIVTDDLVGIIQVDPTTGLQTIISSSGSNFFTGIAIDANGDIIAASIITNLIIRVDPTTGAQTIISSGGLISDPAAIAIDANGDIIVALSFPPTIIKVNPTTGLQTTISSGGLLDAPNGIAIDANGDIIVSDINIGDITKVDPTTGLQTTISSGGLLVETAGIAIDANGDIIVAVIFPPAIIKVNPTTGLQTTISAGGLLQEGSGIVIDANGDILVTDPTAFAIIKVNPTSQTIISSGGLFEANFWLTIYPSLGASDNDGISDEVDTQPSIFSDDFSDVSLGGTTSGTITTRGDQTLTITEEPNPAGVRIAAAGGTTTAQVSACSGTTTINLNAGDEVIVTCTSAVIQVISQIVEVTFVADDGTTAFVTVVEDNSVTFDPVTSDITTPGTNSVDVIVVIDGVTTSLSAGDVLSVEPPSQVIQSLIDAIGDAVDSVAANVVAILGILQDPNFGLEEIKQEVSSIEQNMEIAATKSLSVPVPAASTFVIGAGGTTPAVSIPNPFDPPRDSNINICVDATSLAGNPNNMVTLKLDVSGDGNFSTHSEVRGATGGGPGGPGSTGRIPNTILETVNCFEVAAKEFQLEIVNDEVTPQDVEVAVIWNSAERILP